MAKKKQQPIKTCADCIHENACRMWTDGRYISNDSASRCPNHTTVKDSAAYLCGKLDAKKSLIDPANEDFGTVLNCAVRYALGRQTYMPRLVVDFIRPMLPLISDHALWCMNIDIEEASRISLGDPMSDEPMGKRFHESVKTELRKRSKGE